jgi:hypothetical protein
MTLQQDFLRFHYFLFQSSGHVVEPDNIEKSNTFFRISRTIWKRSISTVFPFHATLTDYFSNTQKYILESAAFMQV